MAEGAKGAGSELGREGSYLADRHTDSRTTGEGLLPSISRP
jgi:hypothetical protein